MQRNLVGKPGDEAAVLQQRLPFASSAEAKEPPCPVCSSPMWLTLHERRATDGESTVRLRYECKACGQIAIQEDREVYSPTL